MEIIGTWKIKEFHLPTPEGVLTYTPDTLPEEEQFEDFAQMARTFLEFTPEGTLDTLMPIPEEMRDEVVAQGVTVRNGRGVIKSTTWKEENGKFYYDASVEGEILGEAVSPFVEIPVQPDGCLLYGMGTILLERA